MDNGRDIGELLVSHSGVLVTHLINIKLIFEMLYIQISHISYLDQVQYINIFLN